LLIGLADKQLAEFKIQEVGKRYEKQNLSERTNLPAIGALFPGVHYFSGFTALFKKSKKIPTPVFPSLQRSSKLVNALLTVILKC